jgi:hypothetical protein
VNKDKTTLQAFGSALRDTMELYDKSVSEDALRVWWAALADYSLEQVRGGLTRHLRDPERGRFPPKPAVVIGAINSAYAERWPSAEACWPIAMGAADEADTVVWPAQEAREAWHAAGEPVYAQGDKVGARVAFREAYNRLIQQAIAQGRTPTAAVSLGHDQQRRVDALSRAVDQGLLTQDQATPYLPPPAPTEAGQALAGLLTGNVQAHPTVDEKTLDRLAQIKRQLKGGPSAPAEVSRPEQERRDRIERERQRQLEALESRSNAS